MTRVDYWNHNVHYQPVILDAVPEGCGAAVDVGCGDGHGSSCVAESGPIAAKVPVLQASVYVMMPPLLMPVA